MSPLTLPPHYVECMIMSTPYVECAWLLSIPPSNSVYLPICLSVPPHIQVFVQPHTSDSGDERDSGSALSAQKVATNLVKLVNESQAGELASLEEVVASLDLDPEVWARVVLQCVSLQRAILECVSYFSMRTFSSVSYFSVWTYSCVCHTTVFFACV